MNVRDESTRKVSKGGLGIQPSAPTKITATAAMETVKNLPPEGKIYIDAYIKAHSDPRCRWGITPQHALAQTERFVAEWPRYTVPADECPGTDLKARRVYGEFVRDRMNGDMRPLFDFKGTKEQALSRAQEFHASAKQYDNFLPNQSFLDQYYR
jgi:hypothetical protein